jgi:hypothetical protein
LKIFVLSEKVESAQKGEESFILLVDFRMVVTPNVHFITVSNIKGFRRGYDIKEHGKDLSLSAD